MSKITILPENKVIHANQGTLLEALTKAGISIDSTCGGLGSCGKCKVHITKGKTPPWTNHECEALSTSELAAGIRLACQLLVTSDLEVVFGGTENLTTRKTRMVHLPSDFTISQQTEDTSHYRLAVDIGTTTVVGMLCDSRRGEISDIVSRVNPQAGFGADVISRITYASKSHENLYSLQKKIIDCINEMLDELITRNNLSVNDVSEVVLAGNTTMSHLALGIDPISLAKAPYKPAFEGAKDLLAVNLGIKVAASANVHMLPSIAGHVGADITAGILATRLTDKKGIQLFIDIGTNGEIVLSNDSMVYACSTAAGPAFEGASIYQGMWAADGAVEAVFIEDGDIQIRVIGGVQPVGICGSGLIDAVAAALNLGVISHKGKMLTRDEAISKELPQKILDRFVDTEQGRAFVLYQARDGKNIVLTQKDIREVQLAKGAIAAGIKLLLAEASAAESNIQEITLAGAFGNYINKESAMRIGLFPKVAPEKVILVGNAAGAGTALAALSMVERKRAHLEAAMIAHVDLASKKEFQKEYLKGMNFPGKS